MNLSELAQHLNLSPTTVSRVLSGRAAKYRISAKTAQRIEEAAQELGVVPDPLGTGLKSGKLGIAGLLVPDITNPFFASLARALELALRQRGMTVQLCDSAEDAPTEVELLRQMLGRRLDGMILAPVGRPSEAFLDAVRGAPVPIVMLDRIVPGLEVPSVSIDNGAAGRLGVQHLVEAGHERIGCLRGDHESFTDRERFRGVMAELKRASLRLDPMHVSGSGYSRESGYAGAMSILRADDPPSAIIALNGQGILGILQAASELDICIPEQLSVVAFDEQPWSAFMSPPLTTIVQPVEQMARHAVDLLAEPGDSVVLQAGIQIRDSVAEPCQDGESSPN